MMNIITNHGSERIPKTNLIGLDPQIAQLGDAGEIENYRNQAFEEIVDGLLQRMPKEKAKPFSMASGMGAKKPDLNERR